MLTEARMHPRASTHTLALAQRRAGTSAQSHRTRSESNKNSPSMSNAKHPVINCFRERFFYSSAPLSLFPICDEFVSTRRAF